METTGYSPGPSAESAADTLVTSSGSYTPAVQPQNVRKTGEWQESRIAAKALAATGGPRGPAGTKEHPVELPDGTSSSSSLAAVRQHARVKKRKELARLELEELELE